MNQIKNLVIFILIILCFGCKTLPVEPKHTALAYTPSTKDILEKSWKALVDGDFDTVHRIVDPYIELHAEEAKISNIECPLNGDCLYVDAVAVFLFIKAEAYYKTQNYKAHEKICNEIIQWYFNGYDADLQSWLWIPAEVCKEKIKISKEKKIK